MGSEASKSMLRLRVIYDEHDGRIAQHHEELAAEGTPVRCGRGCDDCCRLLATCTLPEALAIVQRMRLAGTFRAFVAARPWEALEEDLHRDGMTTLAWMQLRHPCILLDVEARECTVYADRPSTCRQYAVVTDPALCAIPNSAVASPDRTRERFEIMEVSMAIGRQLGIPNAMLPIPVAMKWASIIALDGVGALMAALRSTAFTSGEAATFYWSAMEYEDGCTFDLVDGGARCRLCDTVTPADGSGPPVCGGCGNSHRGGA